MAKTDDMRKALKAAAEDDKDKDCQSRAKKALAAFDTEDKDKSDDKEKDKSKAADDAPEKKDEPEKKGAKAEDDKKDDKAEADEESKALAALSSQLATANAEIAKLNARNAESDFAAFKATRPDIKGEQWTALAGLPLDKIKAVITATPVLTTATLEAVRGPTQGRAIGMTADVASMDPKIARAMGLLPPEPIQGDSVVHYVGVTPAPKAS